MMVCQLVGVRVCEVWGHRVSVCRAVGVSVAGVSVCLCVGDQVSKCWTGVMAVAVCIGVSMVL